MCQNALFDVFGLSEVRYDEGSSVVDKKRWQGERPERGEPPCGESGDGEEQTCGSLHAVDHAEHGCRSGNFLSSVEVILLWQGFFSVDFLFVKDLHFNYKLIINYWINRRCVGVYGYIKNRMFSFS